MYIMWHLLIKKKSKWCFRVAVVSDIPFQTLSVTTPIHIMDIKLQVVSVIMDIKFPVLSDNGHQVSSVK